MSKHERAKRDKVKGWSKRSVKGQRDWFYSIDIEQLDDSLVGWSFTLTLKTPPSTAADFHKLRRSFFERMRRMGMIRAHWLIEWQARKAPHLHGIIYFKGRNAGHHIIPHWLEVAAPYGANHYGQNVKPMYAVKGWLQYLAKHGARGVNHYQRDNANIPEGWETTGRLWGYLADWPIRNPMKFRVDDEGWYLFRRLARSWAIANARENGSVRQISYARGMLRCHDRGLSHVRGTSEWIPDNVSVMFLAQISAMGCRVAQEDG